VLVTSHQAYFTQQSLEAIAHSTLKNASAIAQGQRAPYQID
jgi:lactate dehydrogenase-like 2-hydroxyacid dehydrogenase